MIISIRLDSNEPLYLQIYNSVVSSIARGYLKVDDMLPSSRKLAKDLGINYHTVNKAYQLLETEGFVRVDRRQVTILLASPESKEEFVQRFQSMETEIISEGRAKGLSNYALLKLFQELLEKVAA